MNQYGKEVKAARLAAGLALERMGKRIGSHKGYISGIENGKVNPPSPRITKRICTLLKLDYQRMLALGVIAKMPKALTPWVLAAVCQEGGIKIVTEAADQERALLDMHQAAHDELRPSAVVGS